MPEDQVKIKKQSGDSDNSVCCSDGDHYPYGTSINMEDEMIEEMGVSMLNVGDLVEVRGYAFVDSKSEHANKEESSKSMRFQFTSLKLSQETDDRVKQLYGE